MKTTLIGLVVGFLLTVAGISQVVVPAAPGRKFTTRPIGGGAAGGVEVIPKETPKTRYTTRIVLSVSRLWTSTDAKLLEGKLIAFEDMVVEAPQGAAPPANPTPPEFPTVTRDGKVRLLVNGKPAEVPISRLSKGDQEFIEQVRKTYQRKTPPTP